jgi:TonB family protein
MRRFLRDLTMHAFAAACLLIAPHTILAAPPVELHRAIILRVQPLYPELAKRMGVTGIVILRAVVLPNGTVSEIHIESGHPLLRQAAEEAVRRWRFATDANSSECIVSVAFVNPIDSLIVASTSRNKAPRTPLIRTP